MAIQGQRDNLFHRMFVWITSSLQDWFNILSKCQSEAAAGDLQSSKKRKQNNIKQRILAYGSRQIQAEGMLKLNPTEIVSGKEADSITVTIPLVGKGLGDPRKIFGVT